MQSRYSIEKERSQIPTRDNVALGSDVAKPGEAESSYHWSLGLITERSVRWAIVGPQPNPKNPPIVERSGAMMSCPSSVTVPSSSLARPPTLSGVLIASMDLAPPHRYAQTRLSLSLQCSERSRLQHGQRVTGMGWVPRSKTDRPAGSSGHIFERWHTGLAILAP